MRDTGTGGAPMFEPDEGLAILEKGSSVGTFTIAVMRGYDRNEVDHTVGALEAYIADREAKLHESTRDLATTRRLLQESGEPTWGKLGRRAQEILQLAEEQAADVRSGAERQAAEMRATAAADAARLQNEGEREAALIRRRANEDGESVRNAGESEADRLLGVARQRQEELQNQAKEQAVRARRELEQELLTRRQAAEHEIAALRSSAEREVAEKRSSVAGIQEKAQREAAATHAAASAEAQRVRSLAEQTRLGAEKHSEELESRTEERVRAADERVNQVLARSRRDAERIRTEARAEGERLLEEAHTRVGHDVAAAERQLAELRRQRDDLLQSLARLRDSASGIAIASEVRPSSSSSGASSGSSSGSGDRRERERQGLDGDHQAGGGAAQAAGEARLDPAQARGQLQLQQAPLTWRLPLPKRGSRGGLSAAEPRFSKGSPVHPWTCGRGCLESRRPAGAPLHPRGGRRSTPATAQPQAAADLATSLTEAGFAGRFVRCGTPVQQGKSGPPVDMWTGRSALGGRSARHFTHEEGVPRVVRGRRNAPFGGQSRGLSTPATGPTSGRRATSPSEAGFAGRFVRGETPVQQGKSGPAVDMWMGSQATATVPCATSPRHGHRWAVGDHVGDHEAGPVLSAGFPS